MDWLAAEVIGGVGVVDAPWKRAIRGGAIGAGAAAGGCGVCGHILEVVVAVDGR